MSDKNKWKTQPCKHCIVKTTCKQDCFMWSEYDVKRYIEDNDLQYICINCGIDIQEDEWWCDKCSRRKVNEI